MNRFRIAVICTCLVVLGVAIALVACSKVIVSSSDASAEGEHRLGANVPIPACVTPGTFLGCVDAGAGMTWNGVPGGVNGGVLLLPLDSFDILDWRLNEVADSGTVVNYGTAGTAGNLTVDVTGGYGGGGAPFVNFGAPTRFGSAAKFEPGSTAGARERIYGANAIPDAGASAITVSTWILLPPYNGASLLGWNANNAWNIITKDYYPYGATWQAPYHAVGLYGFANGSFSGNVVVGANGASFGCGGSCPNYVFPTISQNQAAYLQLGQWNHIGVTWDSATNLVSQYMNGRLLGAATSPDAGGIDFNTADGGPWIFGCPGPSGQPGNAEVANMIQGDTRVALIARPLSWFQAAYAAGIQATPVP